MTLWVVRAGRYGEAEGTALRESCAVVGWDDVPDLNGLGDWDAVRAALAGIYTDLKPMSLSMWTGQLVAFRDTMQVGDTIALPLKGQPFVAVGRVRGAYSYSESGPDGAYHRRPVQWLDAALPKANLDQDIIYSLGSLLTVSRPKPPRAEERVLKVIGIKAKPSGDAASPTADPLPDSDLGAQSVEELARDQIAQLIISRFKGHGLAQLVAEVLRAEGFFTTVSPPGADGGVDILAGRGGLGLEPPRVVVQVKSGDGPTDAPTLRQLQGVAARFGADFGLFVSWGGYKTSVDRETAHDYFRIRLWNSRDLIDAVLKHYDRLSAETRSLLPLQRIWAVAPDETL